MNHYNSCSVNVILHLIFTQRPNKIQWKSNISPYLFLSSVNPKRQPRRVKKEELNLIAFISLKDSNRLESIIELFLLNKLSMIRRARIAENVLKCWIPSNEANFWSFSVTFEEKAIFFKDEKEDTGLPHWISKV